MAEVLRLAFADAGDQIAANSATGKMIERQGAPRDMVRLVMDRVLGYHDADLIDRNCQGRCGGGGLEERRAVRPFQQERLWQKRKVDGGVLASLQS